MFIVEGYAVAVVLCVITMLCWGSWANTQKLAGKTWPFELFYWDYVFGVLLMGLIFAFTLGSFGEGGRGFCADVAQADHMSLAKAFIGGVIFNAGNICLVAAIAVAGMSVAFPVGIGLALVLGVVAAYWFESKGDPWLLSVGVALIVVAIIIDALAYRRLPGQSKSGVVRGLVLAILCGLLMGYFFPLVISVIPKDLNNMTAGKISPYTAIVCASFGILASQVVFNVANMIGWCTQDETSVPAYFRGKVRDHLWGVIGGMIWAVGTTFAIIAGGVAGYAVSYGLGQGATMIAAFWGVFIWREFKGAPRGTSPLLALMFIGYIAGLVLLGFAGRPQTPAEKASELSLSVPAAATQTMAVEAHQLPPAG